MPDRPSVSSGMLIALFTGEALTRYLPEHGLPLVQLKERRREIVVVLQKPIGPIGDDELQKIAAIQQTISALEDVIAP